MPLAERGRGHTGVGGDVVLGGLKITIEKVTVLAVRDPGCMAVVVVAVLHPRKERD
ncbi:MAG: hypothetical protein LC790_08235 [Actinobacteria bacterium]|nr:hypothetical protein [Actinomycetota bacterium]